MNEIIFHQITNNNIAYWLGFIAADGSIITKGYTSHFQFGLSSKDKEHLLKFCDFLNIPRDSVYDRQNKCSNGKYYPSSYVDIYNQNIINDLAKYGIVPDKSHQNIDFLSFIPEKYKIPFILGLIDGDGYFINTDKSYGFGFCGNQAVVTSCHKYLHKYFSHWQSAEQVNQYTQSAITYYFTVHTQQEIIDFCELYLSYSNECDLLERKKFIAQLLIISLKEKIKKRQMYLIMRKNAPKGKRIIPKIKQICPICKKEFLAPKFKKQKYCSQECAHKSQYRCEHPDKENLYNKLLENKGNFTQVAKIYGVSDNAIRKWCKKYNIPFHSKDYK